MKANEAAIRSMLFVAGPRPPRAILEDLAVEQLTRARRARRGKAVTMAELDDFVKRLGKEPMPADPLQRGLETIAYALALLALEVRRVGRQAGKSSARSRKGQRPP
jgi:hypothetical protein